MITLDSVRTLRSTIILFLSVAVLLSALPVQAQDDNPVDSVTVLSQQAVAFECCHSMSVTNRQPDSVTISEVRVRLIGGEGEFLVGEARAPVAWNVFLNRRDIHWISQTTDAEIDSGESLPSFRFCIRDTGVNLVVWETYGLDGLLSFDTLKFICGPRDNCDEAFFRPIPSSERCGFDIDLLNDNGQQKKINTFRFEILTPDVTFDTVGRRTPDGWRVRSEGTRSIEWRSSDDGLSGGEYVENFRVFFNSSSNQVRVAWATKTFDDVICVDTLTVRCGITAPDTLFSRPSVNGDTCCKDFLLINTHYPRSPIESFRVIMKTENGSIVPTPTAPEGWSATLNGAGDTLLVTSQNGGLMPGDSLLITDLCGENSLASVDSLNYAWGTLYEGMLVTGGNADFYCRRDVVFCDSVTARVDSSLTAPTRCITLKLDNRNSRQDLLQKFTFHIENPGEKRRIVSATPPSGWSLDHFTQDSVVFHRGLLRPGRSEDGFEFCLNIDTNAFDPLKVTWTTWTTEVSPLCTDSFEVNAKVDVACDSLVLTENSASINPLCCFDLEVFNRNSKGLPIEAIEIRLPSIDLFFDTASSITSGWNVVSPVFPAIAVAWRGDTIRSGESARFSFCVNAGAISARPFVFDVVWRTFDENGVVCFDTLQAFCEGTPGRCDSIYITELPNNEQGCYVSYGVDNLHTPDGVIDNIEFTVLSDDVTILTAEATGSAAGFDNVSLSPKSVIFRGSTIAPGATAGDFSLDFSDNQSEVLLEVCTFEGDLELCCEIDTIACSLNSVERESRYDELAHTIAPNPAVNLLTVAISMEHPGSVTLLLFDSKGVEAGRHEQGIREAGETGFTVTIDELPAGVYHYILQGGEERGRGTIVVVR